MASGGLLNFIATISSLVIPVIVGLRTKEFRVHESGTDLTLMASFKSATVSSVKHASLCAIHCSVMAECTAFNLLTTPNHASSKPSSSCGIFSMPNYRPIPKGNSTDPLFKMLGVFPKTNHLSLEFMAIWGAEVNSSLSSLSKNGLIHGQGQAFVQSKKQPTSVLFFSGEWRNGALDGQGDVKESIKDNDNRVGYEYSGQWSNGLPDGRGTEIAEYGGLNQFSYYVGQFSEGKWDGLGFVNYTWCSVGKNHRKNKKYVGHFKNGHFHGQGELEFCKGAKITGQFENDIMTGTMNLTSNSYGLIYSGEFNKNKQKHGYGEYQYNGNSYRGFWKNDKRDGLGIETLIGDRKRSYSYNGTWKADKKHGQGSLTNVHGTYVGSFNDNKYHGQGVLTSSEGDVSNGQFANGQFVNGLLTTKTGDTYDGQFARKKLVNGTWTTKSGHTYVGQFVNGKLVNGVYTTRKGDTYSGQFAYGRLVVGTIKKKNGKSYEGRFSKGELTLGNLTEANGRSYYGDWLNGKRHGQGVSINNHGVVYNGSWIEDRKEGKGIETKADGSVYVGDWKDDKRHGNGTFTNIDGSVKYEGQWRLNIRHGKGKLVSSVGVYEGDFANGKRSGEGFMAYDDGRTYDGQWANDLREGPRSVYKVTTGQIYTGEWKAGRPVGSHRFKYLNGKEGSINAEKIVAWHMG